MKILTRQFGYTYSTYMNWNSRTIVYGIANDVDILWKVDMSYEMAYELQPYLRDILYG